MRRSGKRSEKRRGTRNGRNFIEEVDERGYCGMKMTKTSLCMFMNLSFFKKFNWYQSFLCIFIYFEGYTYKSYCFYIMRNKF